MALILSGDTGVPASGMPTGSVVQTVTSILTNSQSTTGTSFITSNLSATITPTSATNKILVMVNGGKTYTNGANNLLVCNLYRNGSSLGAGVGWSPCSDANPTGANHSFSYLDSPATTSATIYTPYYRSYNGGTVYFLDGTFSITLTLMEIKV